MRWPVLGCQYLTDKLRTLSLVLIASLACEQLYSNSIVPVLMRGKARLTVSTHAFLPDSLFTAHARSLMLISLLLQPLLYIVSTVHGHVEQHRCGALATFDP